MLLNSFLKFFFSIVRLTIKIRREGKNLLFRFETSSETENNNETKLNKFPESFFFFFVVVVLGENHQLEINSRYFRKRKRQNFNQ